MEFGFWSLVPPLLTIVLALVTKNVFISLLIGIMTGSLVLNGWAISRASTPASTRSSTR